MNIKIPKLAHRLILDVLIFAFFMTLAFLTEYENYIINLFTAVSVGSILGTLIFRDHYLSSLKIDPNSLFFETISDIGKIKKYKVSFTEIEDIIISTRKTFFHFHDKMEVRYKDADENYSILKLKVHKKEDWINILTKWKEKTLHGSGS